jgi:hypothetical protein
MLIRFFPLLALAASCAVSPPPSPDAATSAIEGAIINTCNPINYPCDPNDHLANDICEWVCGRGDGSIGDGYCQPYLATEEIYCMLHPDRFITPSKYCDVWGSPSWYTRCEPGAVP